MRVANRIQADESCASPRSVTQIAGRLALGVGLLLQTGGSIPLDANRPLLTETTAELKTFPIDHPLLTVPCQTAPLRLTVETVGELECVDKATVTSTCEWSARLIDIVEDGTFVREGDVVATLDASDFEEKARNARVNVANAEATFERSRERLKLQRLDAASRLAKLEHQLTLTKLDFEKYRDGDLPRLQKTHAGQVELARESVWQSQEAFDFASLMARKGYQSYSDVDRERIKLRKAEQKLSAATNELTLLEDHEQPRTLLELEAAVETATRDLTSAKAETATSIRTREIDVEFRKKQLRIQHDRLERYETAVAACTLRAPRDGRVVVARQRSNSRANEPLQAGDSVRNRQRVFDVPRFGNLNVDIRIHETLVRHVRVGQPVEIRVDARPNDVFRGTVVEVATVPVSDDYPNRDRKVYPTKIRVDSNTSTGGDLADLRPGMTAQTTIVADERGVCPQVPIQSVVDVAGQPSVFVEREGSVEVRPVDVGLANGLKIEITRGLAPEEQVVLSPKTELTEQLITLWR